MHKWTATHETLWMDTGMNNSPWWWMDMWAWTETHTIHRWVNGGHPVLGHQWMAETNKSCTATYVWQLGWSLTTLQSCTWWRDGHSHGTNLQRQKCCKCNATDIGKNTMIMSLQAKYNRIVHRKCKSTNPPAYVPHYLNSPHQNHHLGDHWHAGCQNQVPAGGRDGRVPGVAETRSHVWEVPDITHMRFQWTICPLQPWSYLLDQVGWVNQWWTILGHSMMTTTWVAECTPHTQWKPLKQHTHPCPLDWLPTSLWMVHSQVLT